MGDIWSGRFLANANFYPFVIEMLFCCDDVNACDELIAIQIEQTVALCIKKCLISIGKQCVCLDKVTKLFEKRNVITISPSDFKNRLKIKQFHYYVNAIFVALWLKLRIISTQLGICMCKKLKNSVVSL